MEPMLQPEDEEMGIRNHFFERVVARRLVSLALLACIQPAGALAQNTQTLSKKELKVLLASAKTSSDEQKLASHYRAQAERLNAKSQDFAKHADFLATQPATIESKQGISCNCTSHYRYFSKQYAQEAKEAEALAQQHEQLARVYTLKPLAGHK